MTDKAKQYNRERAILNYGMMLASKIIKDGKDPFEVYSSAYEKITKMGYSIDEEFNYLLNENKEVV